MQEREIVFSPSFDERDLDPFKNYGVGNVRMCWYLRRPKAVIQFEVLTGWYLQHLKAEFPTGNPYPMAVAIGYHAYEAKYEHQTSMECHLLEGGKCFYSGSGLQAEEYLKLLIEKGSEAVWERMEEFYKYHFERGEQA